MFRSVGISLILAAVCVVNSGCCNKCAGTKIDRYVIAPNAHSAVTAVPREGADWWLPRHQGVLNRISEGNVDMIFIGDSITHGWDNKGKATWDEYYAKRNAVNMGFGGDRTQHVLWRLENGEIDGINPKLAVIMIGTNNSNGTDNTSQEIADGIVAICKTLRTKLPDTKILILAIFPRGDAEQRKDMDKGASMNPQWAKNNEAGDIASKIADNKHIYYLDINQAFLDEKGVLPRDIMPDLLHPNEKGYKIWAEAIELEVAELMGE